MEFSKTIVDDSFVEPGPLLFNPNELWPLKCTPLEMAPQVSHFFFFSFSFGNKSSPQCNVKWNAKWVHFWSWIFKSSINVTIYTKGIPKNREICTFTTIMWHINVKHWMLLSRLIVEPQKQLFPALSSAYLLRNRSLMGWLSEVLIMLCFWVHEHLGDNVYHHVNTILIMGFLSWQTHAEAMAEATMCHFAVGGAGNTLKSPTQQEER